MNTLVLSDNFESLSLESCMDINGGLILDNLILGIGVLLAGLAAIAVIGGGGLLLSGGGGLTSLLSPLLGIAA